MGEEKGLKLFRDIVAKNGVSVRKGHTLLANLVVSGEVPISLTTYLYKVEQLEKDGAPIKGFVLPPEIGRFQGTGIAAHAPHPYAATLFVDWLLTEGQKVFAKRHIIPANIKIQPLPKDMKLTYIDPAKIIDEQHKWEKLYRDIFINQAR
jgi:iron(III) transport system substrate-binding protein